MRFAESPLARALGRINAKDLNANMFSFVGVKMSIPDVVKDQSTTLARDVKSLQSVLRVIVAWAPGLYTSYLVKEIEKSRPEHVVVVSLAKHSESQWAPLLGAINTAAWSSASVVVKRMFAIVPRAATAGDKSKDAPHVVATVYTRVSRGSGDVTDRRLAYAGMRQILYVRPQSRDWQHDDYDAKIDAYLVALEATQPTQFQCDSGITTTAYLGYASDASTLMTALAVHQAPVVEKAEPRVPGQTVSFRCGKLLPDEQSMTELPSKIRILYEAGEANAGVTRSLARSD